MYTWKRLTKKHGTFFVLNCLKWGNHGSEFTEQGEVCQLAQ